MNHDLDRTIKQLQMQGYLQAYFEFFIAYNCSEKKHISLQKGMLVYAHFPQTMELVKKDMT
ncbi:hypothetical protein LG307_03420 [Sutcliffiella horikoshii]|uniref:hypothetical protein n=1 Tax=Sutcliffiella horikoshii TaxID=79883 RepID=UPI003850E957